MVRSETLPFNDYAQATPGQLAWVYLNQLVDYDERVRRIHVHCLEKFNEIRCEVCHEVIPDVSKVDPEIADQIYRPGVDGIVKDVTWTRDKADAPRSIEVFGPDGESEIDVEIE